MLPRPRRFLLLLSVSLLFPLPMARSAQAAVIFDNFDAGGGFHGANNLVAANAFRSGGLSFANRAAARFTVSGGNYALDSITLPISVWTTSGHLLRVRLAADAGGAPGATIETLSQNQVWPPVGNPFTTTTTLPSIAHPVLANGTTCWIVTEMTSFPAGSEVNVDYRWYHNTSGVNVTARQHQQSGGSLPTDPWSGFVGSMPLAFRVEGTPVPTTYTWNVASGSWTAPGNWSPPRTLPAASDILVFDGAVTPAASAAGVPNETVGQLSVRNNASVTLGSTGSFTVSIAGLAGDDLVVNAGSTLTLNATSGSGNNTSLALLAGATGRSFGEMAFQGGAHRILPTDPGSMVFESGSNTRTLTGFIGNLFDTLGVTGAAIFRSGATYHHGGGLHPFGKVPPNSRVVLEPGSLVRYLVTPGNFAFNGRTYGDCEVNTSPAITFVGSTNLGPLNVGNLSLLSGGFHANGTLGWVMNVTGNLTMGPSGVLNLSPAAGTASLSFTGTAVQTVDLNGPAVFSPASIIYVVNPAGLTLSRNLFTDGAVNLSGGPVVTGSHMLQVGEASAVTGSKWVIGSLGRRIPSGAAITRSFPVGDATRAAPVTLFFASATGGGTVVVQTTAGDHPSLGMSGLDPSQSANRTWTVDNLGVSISSYDITLHFDPADLDGAADPSFFRVAKRDGGVGGAWSLPTVGTRTATSTQATGLASMSEFAVAETMDGVAVEPGGQRTAGLAHARPTPFQGSTTLEYTLAREGAAELSIYAVHGGLVRTLHRGHRDAGVHRVSWDGRDDRGHVLGAGIYLARLVTGEGSFHRRMVKIP